MSKSKKEPPLTYSARRMAMETLDVLTTHVHELGGPCVHIGNRAAALRILARGYMVHEDLYRRQVREQMAYEAKQRADSDDEWKPLPQVRDNCLPCPECREPSSLASLPTAGVPPGTPADHVEWECDSCRHLFYAKYDKD